MPPTACTPLFDFDGTLVDSDAALTAPFVALGLTPEQLPPLGLPLVEACDRVGITTEDYLARYDAAAVQPFPGVADLLGGLDRWGLASNKERTSGQVELARFGWTPAVALFSDDFGGREKRLGPLLAALDLDPAKALYVGDTDHDRRCAGEAGVAFALAGWNARAVSRPGDLVLANPADVLALL
jgi:HAD superfamily hydrolase (TIGR01549 family)